MPAFGKRRTGPGRWLNGPRKSIRAIIVLQMHGLRGPGWHCPVPARHAIIGTSGDAIGAQRDTGGSMSADHGRQAESAGTPEPSAGEAQPSAGQAQPLYGGHVSRRLTIRDLAAAKARGEKWPM